LFEALRTGALRIPRIEEFPLHQGAIAHLRLEDRTFSGKIVMTTN
jgi:NADPH2:quinone reductase